MTRTTSNAMKRLTATDVVPGGLWVSEPMPLGRWSKFCDDNLHAVHQYMCRTFGAHKLWAEASIPLSFRHNEVNLAGVSLNATDYGSHDGKIETNIPASGEYYFVQIPLAGQALITYRDKEFELCPDSICVIGGQHSTKQQFTQRFKHLTIKVSARDLEAALAVQLGIQPKGLEFFATPVSLSGEAGALAHLVRTICDDLDSGKMAYTHPRVRGAVEEILKRLILASVPHNYSEKFDTTSSGPCPYYVRRVEEFICDHATEQLSFDDLVAVAGVSSRALHASFQRFRMETPMRYLKRHRLDIARKQLFNGAEEGRTVTDIALDSGFNHLSKFSRDYFERFGELPSDTLKRGVIESLQSQAHH